VRESPEGVFSVIVIDDSMVVGKLGSTIQSVSLGGGTWARKSIVRRLSAESLNHPAVSAALLGTRFDRKGEV
jgi:hypothetical protein